MLNLVLVEPEIHMNTGNIARTCAATRSRLHLIKPLGFDISDKAVKRAGLDYWHMVDLHVYENLDDFFQRTGAQDIWLATAKAEPPLYGGALPARLLSALRQGEHGASPGAAGAVCPAVHPHPHPGGGALPQPVQLRGHPGL